ncbi:hypothetical protein J6590_029850 [Homalodisca vitripennis]|nr:hypothetical protein J6590_029850 [Homalodisca vitripennis]
MVVCDNAGRQLLCPWLDEASTKSNDGRQLTRERRNRIKCQKESRIRLRSTRAKPESSVLGWSNRVIRLCTHSRRGGVAADLLSFPLSSFTLHCLDIGNFVLRSSRSSEDLISFYLPPTYNKKRRDRVQ